MDKSELPINSKRSNHSPRNEIFAPGGPNAFSGAIGARSGVLKNAGTNIFGS